MADARRIAFLGIGHSLRRDDAAGAEVCERIQPALRGREDVLVVNGGSAPENCIGALRRFDPSLVTIIDAARMGQAPGTVLRVEPSDPRAWGASTHTLPLPVFCRYLEETLGCEVLLLGIEPVDTSFGEGLTPAVEEAVAKAVSEVLTCLADQPRPPFDSDLHDSSFRRCAGATDVSAESPLRAAAQQIVGKPHASGKERTR